VIAPPVATGALLAIVFVDSPTNAGELVDRPLKLANISLIMASWKFAAVSALPDLKNWN
jgi:hypothetical protein